MRFFMIKINSIRIIIVLLYHKSTEKNKKMGKNLNWKYAIGVVGMAVIGYAVALFFQRDSLDETIAKKTAEESQRDCPREIDSYTTLDSMSYDISSRTLHYNYTVFDVLDNEILYTDEFREEFREQLLNEIKNKIALKGYKKEGIAFQYTYLSKCSGDPLLDFRFEKSDYNSKTKE